MCLELGVGAFGFRQAHTANSRFVVTPLLTLGAGMEAWLGDHLTAGISTSLHLGGSLSSAEVVLQCGYAWEP